MLRNSWPSPKPQIGPTRAAISSPNSLRTRMLLRLVAGRQHDQVGGERLAALHPHAVGDEGFDIGKLDQPDRAAGDQIGAADVEIIAAAAGEVFELPAGAAVAEIELEADRVSPSSSSLSSFFDCSVSITWLRLRQRQRHRGRDQVVILQRPSL